MRTFNVLMYDPLERGSLLAGLPTLIDVVLGAGDSFPSHITNVNNTVFFVANAGASGNELWVLSNPNSVTTPESMVSGGERTGSPLAFVRLNPVSDEPVYGWLGRDNELGRPSTASWNTHLNRDVSHRDRVAESLSHPTEFSRVLGPVTTRARAGWLVPKDREMTEHSLLELFDTALASVFEQE
ncbi:MAG TPA: hypothetical protein PKD54_04490 [Pirellulaceae bacterium]|nr:hypothetical protein [Pirellulaceae bacterium]